MVDIYGSVAGFKTYHTERGRDVSGYSDQTIAAKLIVGTEWLDNKYRNDFPGTKIYGRSQVREWPRVGAVDAHDQVIPSDIPPIEVEHATYEATLRELQQVGSLTVDYTPSKYKSAAVSGAVSVQYADRDGYEAQTHFVQIDMILSALICGGSSNALVGSSSR